MSIEEVDRSDLNSEKQMQLLSSLTPLRQFDRLPAFLHFLKTEGDRALYRQFLQEVASPVQRHDVSTIDRFHHYQDTLNHLIAQLSPEEAPLTLFFRREEALIGWDMARLELFSEMAYARNLMANREMWATIIYAWRHCATLLDSWQEMAASCLLGYALQSGTERIGQLLKTYRQMVGDPLSPWSKVALK